jgi:hypothetical protein
MRRLVIAVAVGTLVLAAAPSALAGPKRADSYYTVMCIDPGGNLTEAESVDARAIEQGGKDHAIDLFNANHPGWSCWAEGPFTG